MSELRLIKLCEEDGCQKEAMECLLHYYDYESGKSEDIISWYCGEHAHKHGFCPGCGLFWGGVERFEFSRTGLCENCESDLDAELYEEEDAYIYP